MSRVPLSLLLRAARAVLHTRYEAIPRLSTLDGEHWQALAVDIETTAHRTDLPTGTDTSPEGAVSMLLEALQMALPWEAAFTPADLAALAAEYPHGFTWTPTAPGDDTVDAEMPHAVGEGR